MKNAPTLKYIHPKSLNSTFTLKVWIAQNKQKLYRNGSYGWKIWFSLPLHGNVPYTAAILDAILNEKLKIRPHEEWKIRPHWNTFTIKVWIAHNKQKIYRNGSYGWKIWFPLPLHGNVPCTAVILDAMLKYGKWRPYWMPYWNTFTLKCLNSLKET